MKVPRLSAIESKCIATGPTHSTGEAMKQASTHKDRTTKAVPGELWNLRLYIAGTTPKSMDALRNLKEICATNLDRKYRVEVIDLLENPQLAKGDQILAIPT